MTVTLNIKRREDLADVKIAEAKEYAEEDFGSGRFSAPPSRQA